MEALLSTSFDLLSSYDPAHVRKGLRCLEGFLAKMCLQPGAMPGDDPSARPKDAAFREFLRLQSGFEWNVTTRLIACLERLLGRTSTAPNNALILSTLDLIQGLLLLHPSSRKLFARELHMNVLLDLLDSPPTSSSPNTPQSSPSPSPVSSASPTTNSIQSATLLTLVHCLLDHPANTRTFEALDGLATVSALFKRRDTPKDVKLKILEFLYFYLMPEPVATSAAGVPGMILKEGERRLRNTEGKRKVRVDRTTEEKMEMLSELLGETQVQGLVGDLRMGRPFGV